MPIIKGVTTKSSESIWKSPDGQRELFKVTFDYEGKAFQAKSYSTTIINQGWSGDIEIEERQGKQGLETFAKQAPKEGASSGSYGASGERSSGGSSGSKYQPKDEKAIQAMWAIGQSIAAHNGSEGLQADDLSSVESYAVEVFNMVDRVKQEVSTDTTDPAQSQLPVKDTVITDVDEPISFSELDKILGGEPEVIEDEPKWKSQS